MANHKKPAKPFLPGNTTGKLGGRPKDPPELKAFKQMNRANLITAANRILSMTLKELQELAQREDAPVHDVMLAGVCLRIMTRGDMQAFEILLRRLIGVVPGDPGTPPPATGERVVFLLPDNGKRLLKDVTPKDNAG
jgi:hypothetical protein